MGSKRKSADMSRHIRMPSYVCAVSLYSVAAAVAVARCGSTPVRAARVRGQRGPGPGGYRVVAYVHRGVAAWAYGLQAGGTQRLHITTRGAWAFHFLTLLSLRRQPLRASALWHCPCILPT